jgi:ParB family chromosome partitioning protein
MSSKTRRGGLGRGLGALIPTAPVRHSAEAAEAPFPAERADVATVATMATSVAAPAVDGSMHPDRRPERWDGAPPALHSVETGPTPIPGVQFRELPVASIRPNAKQPRQVFDDDGLAELAHSIREFGVLQPVVVRPVDTGGQLDGEQFELVMGERRLRAAVAAGLPAIPAIVRSTSDDAMLRDALLENIHRTQLNPLEEAAAYQQLLEEFGTTHDELAQRIGRSRPHVTNTIRLLNLPLAVQRRVAAGVLSAGHARALLTLDDADQQDEVAARIVAEGLSVRGAEELVTLTARGHGRPTARRSPAPRITAPGVTDLADRLSDVLDTRVRVEVGKRKGRITVEFASVDDLERIVALMAPQLRHRPAEPAAGPADTEGADDRAADTQPVEAAAKLP